MGLFSRNWDKPGPGVEKDAPQKNAFFKYFELVVRKIWQLITQNLLFFLVTLPVIITVYMLAYTYLIRVFPDLYTTVDGELVVPPLASVFVSIAGFLPTIVLQLLTAVSLLFYGPFMMGLTYVMRNYVREEHAWTSDFFSRAFSNFGQGLFFGVIDILAVVIFYVNWNYSTLVGATGNTATLALILRGITIALMLFFLAARNYSYQLAVTVNLKIGAIIKNSMIFAVLGFGRNVISLLACAVIVIFSLFLTSFLDLLMVPFLMFALLRFTAVYVTYPVVDRYVVQPALEIEQMNAPDDDEDEDEEYRARLRRVEMFELPPELGGPGAGNLGMERLEREKETQDNTSENLPKKTDE